ncbi:tellurite resistance/C4-dicarboxylate transporter family protein [Amycolatopsis sp. FDAARGOS 1241]|uniref:tellurite resistance/C4-dicarboxylate transporter family protein n=1 Tax=Amycolatopsis sp. FDAARGOS 1241 TaxID=2778070 RepID=UPI00194FB2C8|nr:tellurite resistance/C4-dicarboxylate transporter family protein [Amycolatopsis sp. FDAARGOS 1241]QRP42763.1 tellurite resistance/C4-dicarboxylate transporter family protein [Amycolatopsis sp. FDAARGOS 1241]
MFAFVMATGIVSTALKENGVPVASDALLVIGLGGYLGLIAASGWRLLRWPHRMLADVISPRGFAFLTFAAASNVLAARLALGGWWWPASSLLILGVASWLTLGYGVPLGLIADPRRHPSLDQVNGTWFIWVVGTQSVAVAAASLAPFGPDIMLATVGAVCWAIGLLLYLLLAGLGLARLLVRPVAAQELVPPYWVFMGAGAITILAAAQLLALPTTLLSRGVLADISLVLWSFCSWLIPLLVALGVWRHVVRRVPLPYESALWSLVFPVGMYGVASDQLGHATGIRWLAAFGAGEAWLALAVWAVVFAAMLVAGGRWLRGDQAVRGRHDARRGDAGPVEPSGHAARPGQIGDDQARQVHRDTDVGR